MTLRSVLGAVALLFVSAFVHSASASGEYFPAHAAIFEASGSDSPIGKPWHLTFAAPEAPAPIRIDAAAAVDSVLQDNQRPIAFEYSHAYNVRRKIHMVASYATVPLFVAQYLAGEKLFDDSDNSSAKSAHGALTIGIASLFAVNSVTGVWNLLEARKDPNGHTRRLVHGLMMLAADAGFVATGALAPDDDGGASSRRSTHRTVALSSMGVSVASYVYMLVTR